MEMQGLPPGHRSSNCGMVEDHVGCLNIIGMVLEYLEGGTLYNYLKQHMLFLWICLWDFHNQLLNMLMHLHTHRQSHGDFSMFSVKILERQGELTLKPFNFGQQPQK